MKETLKGYSIIEVVVVCMVAIAGVLGAIAAGNALLRSHYVNQIVSDVEAIVVSGKQWMDETGGDVGNITNMGFICVNGNVGSYLIRILDSRICGVANNGVGTNPFRGDYTVSGTSSTETSPPLLNITITKVPSAEGARVVSLLSQEKTFVSANYNAGTGTVSFTGEVR